MRARTLPALLLIGLTAGTASATNPAPVEDPASRIIGAAIVESRAWDKLAYLSDHIGHRLSGSAALERAVAWTAEELRRDGIDRVWTEPVMVPHWQRGTAAAAIVAPLTHEMPVLALGGSVATPEQGVTAEVIVVTDFEELDARAADVRGKIVLYNKPIQAGFGSEHGYGSAVGLRVHGASRAAKHGAVATLIRSLGTADYRLPHTGGMRYDAEQPKIPAAAIAAEDAGQIARLLEAGETVRVQLQLGSRWLPDAESANVLAEIPGRELPEEIVLIGAHLDTWDVGQGAHDDGAGCAIVMETMRLIKRLGLRPRRTIRAVLFTNEENGLRGGRDYAARHGQKRHVAAIESDSGGFAPLGFGVSAGPGGVELVQRIAAPLAAVGADAVTPGGGGADISPLKQYGVPLMGLRQESRRYFDYHHTAADTLDKVSRSDLDRNVAALALMAWGLAEHESTLPRLPVEETEHD